MHPIKAICSTLLLPLCAHAGSGELIILVDTATEMPMARFERGRLVDGIHRDVGLALAEGLGRNARFMALPRKRIAKALAAGTADVLCSYVPEWLDGQFGWSRPFIPISQVLITDLQAARAASPTWQGAKSAPCSVMPTLNWWAFWGPGLCARMRPIPRPICASWRPGGCSTC
jgi:hypothetical protein